MWRKRCYFDDIPEELPDLLQATNRAPSWKKIAICLLKNDTKLRGLGFTEKTYDKVLISSIEAIRRDSDQGEFDLRVSFAEPKPPAPTQTGFDV